MARDEGSRVRKKKQWGCDANLVSALVDTKGKTAARIIELQNYPKSRQHAQTLILSQDKSDNISYLTLTSLGRDMSLTEQSPTQRPRQSLKGLHAEHGLQTARPAKQGIEPFLQEGSGQCLTYPPSQWIHSFRHCLKAFFPGFLWTVLHEAT